MSRWRRGRRGRRRCRWSGDGGGRCALDDGETSEVETFCKEKIGFAVGEGGGAQGQAVLIESDGGFAVVEGALAGIEVEGALVEVERAGGVVAGGGGLLCTVRGSEGAHFTIGHGRMREMRASVDFFDIKQMCFNGYYRLRETKKCGRLLKRPAPSGANRRGESDGVCGDVYVNIGEGRGLSLDGGDFGCDCAGGRVCGDAKAEKRDRRDSPCNGDARAKVEDVCSGGDTKGGAKVKRMPFAGGDGTVAEAIEFGDESVADRHDKKMKSLMLGRRTRNDGIIDVAESDKTGGKGAREERWARERKGANKGKNGSVNVIDGGADGAGVNGVVDVGDGGRGGEKEVIDLGLGARTGM